MKTLKDNELVRGNWYGNHEWGDKSIVKFSHFIGDRIHFTETLLEGTKYDNGDDCYYNYSGYCYQVDINDYKKYLPKNYKFEITYEIY